MLRAPFVRAAIALTMILTTRGAPPARATAIDFDTYPGGGAVPPGATIFDQWSGLGVVFSDGNGGAVGASNNACSLTVPNHAYAPTIVARFVDPATGAQALTAYAGTAQDNCWAAGEGIAMRAYGLHGELLGSVFNSGGGHFESFSFPEPRIARLEMDCVLQGIDGFVFDVPSAASVAPAPGRFGFVPMRNPIAPGNLEVRIELRDANPARFELLDPMGRRLEGRDVGMLGAGTHAIPLLTATGLTPGIYFLRLRQRSEEAVLRFVVVR